MYFPLKGMDKRLVEKVKISLCIKTPIFKISPNKSFRVIISQKK